MQQELAESISDPQTVTIVEWAGIVEDVLPKERLTIQITATSEETRQFECAAPPTLAYLLGGVSL